MFVADEVTSTALNLPSQLTLSTYPFNVPSVDARFVQASSRVQASLVMRPSLTPQVITGHAGNRVLIGNTDAEGRLVLADVLSHLRHRTIADLVTNPNPTFLCLATLTGHAVRSVGPYAVVYAARELEPSTNHRRIMEIPLTDHGRTHPLLSHILSSRPSPSHLSWRMMRSSLMVHHATLPSMLLPTAVLCTGIWLRSVACP